MEPSKIAGPQVSASIRMKKNIMNRYIENTMQRDIQRKYNTIIMNKIITNKNILNQNIMNQNIMIIGQGYIEPEYQD